MAMAAAAPAFIMLLAFATRFGLAFAANVDQRAEFAFDPSAYDFLARVLAGLGVYIGYDLAPTALFAPGYPFVLALHYRLFGDGLPVAWTLNASCGALAALFIYLIGVRTAGRRVGAIAATLFALAPGNVFYSVTTLTEPLFGAALTGALLAFMASDAAPVDRDWRWVCCGMLLGLASLVRGVGLMFLGGIAAGWWFDHGFRVAARRLAISLCGVTLALAPWTVRNAISMGAPIPIAGDAALAFFCAHNELATGKAEFAHQALADKLWPDLRRMNNPQREVTVARRQWNHGFRHFLEHPIEDVSQIPARFALLCDGDHTGYYALQNSRNGLMVPDPGKRRWKVLVSVAVDRAVVAVIDRAFFTLTALAAIGAIIGWRYPNVPMLVFCIVIVTSAHVALFVGDPRYHDPFVPAFSVLAAVTVDTAWRRWRAT